MKNIESQHRQQIFHHGTKKTRPSSSKKKLGRFSILSMLVLTFASLFLIYWTTLRSVFDQNLSERDLVPALQENRYHLRTTALNASAVEYYASYVEENDFRKRNFIKYAKLIHKFTHDFYGRPYRLNKFDEMRLLAYISYHNFDSSDVCNLQSPLIEDSLSLKKRIMNKVSGYEVENPYFNPVIHQLLQTRNIYRNELEEELRKVISNPEIERLIHELKDTTFVADSLSSHNFRMLNLDAARYYKRIIGELGIELNLRLAIIYLAIGKDYGVTTNKEFIGWFLGGYKGKSLMKRYWVRPKVRPVRNHLLTVYSAYQQHYKKVLDYYDSIDLKNWQMRMYSPLNTSLEIKPVGFFGARRKHDDGSFYKHQGVDLAAEEGTPIYPVQDGYVYRVGHQLKGWGNHIEIWHDNQFVSTYSHLSDDKLFMDLLRRFDEEGPFSVTRKEQIGSVGRTGNIPRNDAQYGYPHLHLEIRKSARFLNPLVLINKHFKVIHN